VTRIYQLKVYDVTYTTLQETINDEALISGSVTFELSGEESLKFNIDRDHADFADLALGKVIELYHTVEAAVIKAFRVVSIIDLRNEYVYMAEVTCEGLKYDLNKRIFKFFGSIIEQTPTTHLTEILSGSGWTVGTVTPTTPLTIQYNYDTVLSALQKVKQSIDSISEFSNQNDLEFTDAFVVNLNTIGNLSSTSTIEWQKNLKSIRRENSIPEATRIYGIGGEGNRAVPMTIDSATHRITAIVEGEGDFTVVLDSLKILSNGGEFADGNYVLVGEDDSSRTILATQKGDPYDEFTVSGAALNIGDKVRIFYNPTGIPIPYNYDIVGVTGYGIRETIFRDENFSDGLNLIGPYNSSALSGTYASGLCEGWTKVGNPTVTENTNTAIIINGTKSQKVVVSAFSASPSSFTVTENGSTGSGELDGVFTYKLAWVTTDGEGPLSDASIEVTPEFQRILVDLNETPHALATHWRIYRTHNAGATYYFVADVPVAQSTFYDALGDDLLSKTSPGNTAAGGQGVQRTFTAVSGKEYASLVWIFVESGRVRIELEAGDIVPEKELGQKRATPTIGATTKFIVKTEGLVATDTDGKIRVVAHEGAATFYVDSAFVGETAYAPNSDRFVADNDATQLWYATFDELQKKKVVAEKISLSAVDLYETIEFSGQNKISIGDLIEVIDFKLGIDTFVRVVKKSFDLLQPWNAQFEVSSSPNRFTTDYIDRIKRENTIGTAQARQFSRTALATRNLLGSVNNPVVEILKIES